MNAEVKFVTAVPVVAIAVLLATTVGSQPCTAERYVGLALLVLGVALLTVARFNLGNSFSVSPQAKQLVTRGVYSRVQHPVYVFSAVALVGIVLYFGKPVLLLVLIVLIPIQVARAHKEGAALEEKFGDDYRAWKRATWF